MITVMYYVYVDYATKGERAGQAYYVGQGNEKRIACKARNNVHFDLAIEHGFRREVVFATNDRMCALEVELSYIQELNTWQTKDWGANMIPIWPHAYVKDLKEIEPWDCSMSVKDCMDPTVHHRTNCPVCIRNARLKANLPT